MLQSNVDFVVEPFSIFINNKNDVQYTLALFKW